MDMHLPIGIHDVLVCHSAFPLQTTTSLKNTGVLSSPSSDSGGEGVVPALAGKMETEQ
jgi:hypothetical protein